MFNILWKKCTFKWCRVVSSGHFGALFVLFFPLNYIPTIPPHSTYVIVNGFGLFKTKGACRI